MRQLTKLSVLTIVISTTSGCSWLWGEDGYFRNRSNDYLQARQAPMLVIPGNLKSETRPFDPLYPIPNNIPNSVADKNFEVPRPPALQNTVGDVNSNISSLQNRQGVQWFIAHQTVPATYNQALQYFRQSGFHINTTLPETGEFTTDWLEANALTSVLGSKLLAKEAALKDHEFKVRVRVEPGVNANTSEVYALAVLRPIGSFADINWPATSQNTALESVLLDELMLNIAQSPNDTISSNPVAIDTIAILDRDSQNIPVLRMNGDMNLVWTRVERAISTADIKLDDMDRASGVYYIDLAKKADGSPKVGFFGRLFSSADSQTEPYIIKMVQEGDKIVIRVYNTNNGVIPSDKAEAILKLLKENMQKNS